MGKEFFAELPGGLESANRAVGQALSAVRSKQNVYNRMRCIRVFWGFALMILCLLLTILFAILDVSLRATFGVAMQAFGIAAACCFVVFVGGQLLSRRWRTETVTLTLGPKIA